MRAFSAGRKRSRRTMQPKDTKELELDVTDAMYSSSQQINGQQKPGTYHVAVALQAVYLPSFLLRSWSLCTAIACVA